MNRGLESKSERGRGKGGRILTGLLALATLGGARAFSDVYITPRVGAIIPVAAQEQSYNPSPIFGAAFGYTDKQSGLGFEVMLDYFPSSAEYITTNSFLPGVDITYSPFKGNVKPYIFAGGRLLLEDSTIDIPPPFDIHDTMSNTTAGIEGGIGLNISDTLDLRAAYIGLPQSENVKGMVTVTAGWKIPIGKK